MFSMKTLVALIAVLMYALVILFQNKKVLFTTGAAVLVVIIATFFRGRFSRFRRMWLRLKAGFRREYTRFIILYLKS